MTEVLEHTHSMVHMMCINGAWSATCDECGETLTWSSDDE